MYFYFFVKRVWMSHKQHSTDEYWSLLCSNSCVVSRWLDRYYPHLNDNERMSGCGLPYAHPHLKAYKMQFEKPVSSIPTRAITE